MTAGICFGADEDKPTEWPSGFAVPGEKPEAEKTDLEKTYEFLRTKHAPYGTLTQDWFGYGPKLAARGIEVNLGLTQIYQINLQGGLSTHRRSGRYTGSYDLEVELDLAKLAKLQGGYVYMYVEGAWSRGLDYSSIGSVMGPVNNDAFGDHAIFVAELWYEQAFFNGKLRGRIGKMDLTGGIHPYAKPIGFDRSLFANDETGQFLNSSLANNPTIPFPDRGLGVAIQFQPIREWYVAAAVQDAQGDARETGFNTAFSQEDYFFTIVETGLTIGIPSVKGPLTGNYRVGFWYDPQNKPEVDGTGSKSDDMGMYLSFDQLLLKEIDDPEDKQGLGVFARYGFADSNVSAVKCFWSVGGQYQGLIPKRDQDVLGIGCAQGRLVEDAGYSTEHETALEVYYGVQVTPWLNVAPSFQYIFNPGGIGTVDDAMVIGVRAEASF